MASMMSPRIARTGTRARLRNVSSTSKPYGGSIMAIKLPQDFKEFLRLLRSHGVRYLLVGGHAVGYHGYPRATGDMDIWVALEPGNADRIVTALREFGFDVPELDPGLFLEHQSLVRMGNSPLRIEIMTTISGVSFDDCYADLIDATIDGVQVSLIDLTNLKKNKRASGRLKDLADLEQLP